MRPEKSDRRSQRTRQLISDALVSLLLEQRYADLTIQDILDRANVGRSTFYAHYQDKDDLLISTIERVFAQLRDQHDSADQGLATFLPSLALIQRIHSHAPLYKALVRGGA